MRFLSAATDETLPQFMWRTRYRDDQTFPPEADLGATWRRVAAGVAAIEREPEVWRERFLGILRNFRFLPGGRILAGAGTQRQVTLCNCFVMGLIDDSVEGIFEALKEGALTMQQGGGIGYDFSTLRPRGARARTSGTIASGPVSFMQVWDAMCATVLSTGARRGAMMATLRCDHPDIEEFVAAKRDARALPRFNLSVLVTDAFMEAVKNDSEWALVFPEQALQGEKPAAAALERAWSGSAVPVACRVHRVIRARELWTRLCDSAYDCAEPGVLFIDRINAENNLGYCETLSATNPCAEEPLPSFGACNLGSVNLTAFVLEPFTPRARLDQRSLREVAPLAVRFLDDVIEISRFPLPRQREQAQRSRRVGLGITGLADALAMLGLRYDSEAARTAAADAMKTLRDAAYEASVELAGERGAFPAFEARQYLERPFIRRLPARLQEAIRRQGIRNSHLLAIAPAGSISLLADNVSSGIEPIFGRETARHVLDSDGRRRDFLLTDYAYAAWRARRTDGGAPPDAFCDWRSLSSRDQLLMQASLQPHVDGAISKTVMLPHALPPASVMEIFQSAYELGLKGCTVFREGARRAIVAGAAAPTPSPVEGAHCYDIERECD
ncbi:MAG TPA: adenosylcobalamin-dependent ribonucleoside-diphosphate reductase [Steroidobacteraceae bacterium]|nr:adenosylcobalamin-dependent ribonucleoside-diphosphate reductase [Steroidobacteraceae bacterium]